MPRRRAAPALLALLLAGPALAAAPAAPPPAAPATLDEAAAGRFAALALACVHQEYPNKPAPVFTADADVRPPRAMTPAFYGCFDWHSAVHGHWLLARLARRFPAAPFAALARGALAQSLTAEHLAAEAAFLDTLGKASYERPYGLAWLLALAAELRGWDDPQARVWSAALAPVEQRAAARLAGWLPRLRYPVRIGEHSQTAFALGLTRDWAVSSGDAAMVALVDERARAFFLADRACPIGYEPSGEDFLSPCLGEADLMRRVLAPAEFARWLSGFLPGVPVQGGAAWLAPGVVTDRSDPKLAHLDGLNLSRARALARLATRVPDGRADVLVAAARTHARAGLAQVVGGDYMSEHWLATFAIELLTQTSGVVD